MIVAFYVLYVLLTPVNFSWLWFIIALLMQMVLNDEMNYRKQYKNYWKEDK